MDMKFEIAKITKAVDRLREKTEQTFGDIEEKTGIELNYDAIDSLAIDSNRQLSLVFIGQYSGGKSSIIKMLTGDEDVEIGAGITTGARKVYKWSGMDVVDTPGIQTGIRPDHDAITYKAIAKADLLVYVITNEGFDSLMIDNFKKIAYETKNQKNNEDNGVGKLNEMILVVNKMARTGNTPENQCRIEQDIRNVLPPDETDNLRICFLDAESYLDYMVETDEEIKEELLERSGYEVFVDCLNDFAKEKGLAGRLNSPVQQLEAALKDAIGVLKGSTGDANADGADSILRSTINRLRRSRRRGETELNAIFRRHAMAIRSVGQELAGSMGSETFESVQQGINDRLLDISNACREEVENKVEELNEELSDSIEEILTGEFAQNIQSNIGNSNSEAAQKTRDIFNGLQKFSSAIAKNVSTDIIKQIGHLFGHKFRPWEAVKYLRFLKAVDKYLPYIGVVLDIAIELWDQNKQREAREQLAAAQRECVASFNSMAADFQRDGMQMIQRSFLDKMDELIDQQENLAKSLDKLKKDKSRYIGDLEALVSECHKLTRLIRMA